MNAVPNQINGSFPTTPTTLDQVKYLSCFDLSLENNKERVTKCPKCMPEVTFCAQRIWYVHFREEILRIHQHNRGLLTSLHLSWAK